MSGENMTFWDHLDELRGVLVKIAILLAVLAVGCFVAMPRLFDDVILAPCNADFPLYRSLDSLARLWPGSLELRPDFHVELVSVELTSQFMIHVSASLPHDNILAVEFRCSRPVRQREAWSTPSFCGRKSDVFSRYGHRIFSGIPYSRAIPGRLFAERQNPDSGIA